MKNIVYNNDNLKRKDMNNIIKRAKILFEYNDEIVVCNCNNNYFFLGGHVDNNETDYECLNRETKEEAGLDIDYSGLEPFVRIEYYNKDYPSKGINTLSIAHYYHKIYDINPNYKNTNLTKEEAEGNFKIEKINKNKIIDTLIKSLASSTRRGVTIDTIDVLKEYLNESNNN